MTGIEDIERAIKHPEGIERFAPVSQPDKKRSKKRKPDEPRLFTIVATYPGDKVILNSDPRFKRA